MAIVRLDSNLLAIHGRIGDVVYKTYGRKIVVTRVPCFDGYVPTPAQRARRARMAEATAYAKRIYADPAAKSVYITAAKQLHRHPFRLAVSDYLNGHPRIAFRSELEMRRPRRVAQPSNPPNLFTGGNREHGEEAIRSLFPPFPSVNHFSSAPCRIRLMPRAPRRSSPLRPPRPWRETVRALAKPPRPVRQAQGLEPVERRRRRGSSSPPTGDATPSSRGAGVPRQERSSPQRRLDGSSTVATL